MRPKPRLFSIHPKEPKASLPKRHRSLAAGLFVLALSGAATPTLGEPLIHFDERGCTRAPALADLTRDGGDLVVTIALPVSDDPEPGIWVIQRDAAGDIVGEVFHEAGFETEANVSIPDGVRAALERGPAFVLSILDAERRSTGPEHPFMIKLDCPEAPLCTLEPVLGVSPGDALHASPQLLTEIGNRIDSDQPIGFDAISTARPDLQGALLDLFWQQNMHPSEKGMHPSNLTSCHCQWLVATDATSLTGGAHLIWAGEPAHRGGTTRLGSRLWCFRTTEPQDHEVAVDVGSILELSVRVFDAMACPRPCDPRIEHGFHYQAAASTAQFPVGIATSVENHASWIFDSGDDDGPPPVWTIADSSTVTATTDLAQARVRIGDHAISRFEGETTIAIDADPFAWDAWVTFGSRLSMHARSEGCDGVAPLEASILIAPTFSRADRCDVEIHKSLRIGG